MIQKRSLKVEYNLRVYDWSRLRATPIYVLLRVGKLIGFPKGHDSSKSLLTLFEHCTEEEILIDYSLGCCCSSLEGC